MVRRQYRLVLFNGNLNHFRTLYLFTFSDEKICLLRKKIDKPLSLLICVQDHVEPNNLVH